MKGPRVFLTAASTLWCVLTFPGQAQSSSNPDAFYYLTQMNKAQLVMLEEENLLPTPLVRRIAEALQAVVQMEEGAGIERSGDYLVFEQKLVERVGPEASNLHLGRSRNDLGTSYNRLLIRDRLLVLFEALLAARTQVLELASHHTETVVPAYTHGVQAQPTSLAHYLLALDSALERDCQRLAQVYPRLNQSTLGSGALSTSGFPLNRRRLAELLGFDGLVENSYDAICVSVVDSKVELSSVAATSALSVGRFAQDLILQYGDPQPGLYLADEVTGRSSIMPQKRSPSLIETLRRTASVVVGEAQTIATVAHNTPFSEVGDVRYFLTDRVLALLDLSQEMYRYLQTTLAHLVVVPERFLAKIHQDYSTMTEVADTLWREAGVPFRTGHRMASELTTYGRSLGKGPADLSYAEVSAVYQRVTGDPFPLTPQQYQKAIDPKQVVFSRRGQGGPSPQETARMIESHSRNLEEYRQWIQQRKDRIRQAQERLEQEFRRLLASIQ